MLDDLQLEQVCTPKGKHTHKRRPGSMLAICYAKGPFSVVSDAEAKERRLTPCANCKRREARLRAGDTRQAQGEKNFDAVVPIVRPSRTAIGLDFIRWKRMDLGLGD
jgi:hypothetical protein